jgi:hypothetical protein
MTRGRTPPFKDYASQARRGTFLSFAILPTD